MSTDQWRWAEKAQQLRFEQLEAARDQAERWRVGLAALTTVIGAVLIVKGKGDVSGLSTPVRWLAVAAFGTAIACLVIATILALRASAGTPSDRVLLTGEDLRTWTRREVVAIRRDLDRAARLTLAGVVIVGVATGVVWLAPSSSPAGGLVTVESGGGRVCGTLVGAVRGGIVVAASPGRVPTTVRLEAGARIRTVRAC